MSLGFPLTLEHLPDLARSFVDSVRELEGIGLEYADESLKAVDAILGTFERDGSDVVAETLVCAGCYIGEVLVRAHGYRWVAAPEETQQILGFRYVVEGPDGSFANPIGKVFKRVENGPEDNIWFFVRVLTDDSR